MRNRWLALAACVVAAGLVVGCGGDDDDDGGNGGATTEATTEETATIETGEPLSKSEYISRANEICREANAELTTALQEAFPEGAPSDVGEVTDAAEEIIVPNLADQLDQLRQLPAPEGDEAELADIYDEYESGLDEAREDPGSLVSVDPFENSTEAFRDYGIEECGFE